MSYNIHHDDRLIQRQSAWERQRHDNEAENAQHYKNLECSSQYTQTEDPTCYFGNWADCFRSCSKGQAQIEKFVQCNGGYFLQTEKKNGITKLKLLQLAWRKTILDLDKRGKTNLRKWRPWNNGLGNRRNLRSQKKWLLFLGSLKIQSFRIQLQKIANIWRIKREGISVIKFEAARLHFLSNVFVAVAIVVA